MTDNEIIKGLECCSNSGYYTCKNCPYNSVKGRYREICDGLIRKDALDLIKRLTEERDAVIAAQETLQKYIAKQDAELDKLRTENAINADAYIKAVAAFEAEKAEKERLLKELEKRQGEWIDTGDFELDNIYSGYKCSACGFVICGHSGNYCPDCGAKMKNTEGEKWQR